MLALSLAAIGCNVTPAEPAACTLDTECDDSDDCTEDRCGLDGLCNHEEIPDCEPFVACATDGDCDDGDDCTDDRCGLDHFCINEEIPDCDPFVTCTTDADCDDGDDCTDDRCGLDDACINEEIASCGADGPLSGVADLLVADDGDAMLFAVYSTDPVYQAYLEEEEAAAAIAIGTCAPLTYGSPGGVTLTSMGDLVIEDGGTVVTTVPPDAYGRYDSYLVPFTVTIGQSYDLVITGAPPATTGSTITNAFEVSPLPGFTNLTFASDTIDGTFTYTPVPVDRMFLTFQYFTTEPAIVRCRLDPAAGSFTMDATTYAALGQSGTIRAELENVRRGTIHGADQDRALSISTSRGTPSGSYTKAP